MNDLVLKARHITEYISYELKDLSKEEFYMVVSYIAEHLNAKVASELQAAYTTELLKPFLDSVSKQDKVEAINQTEVEDE